MIYRYYSILRPVSIGTFPDRINITEIHNFDYRTEAESWRNWAMDVWHELQELVYAKRLNRKKLIALAERMEGDL